MGYGAIILPHTYLLFCLVICGFFPPIAASRFMVFMLPRQSYRFLNFHLPFCFKTDLIIMAIFFVSHLGHMCHMECILWLANSLWSLCCWVSCTLVNRSCTKSPCCEDNKMTAQIYNQFCSISGRSTHLIRLKATSSETFISHTFHPPSRKRWGRLAWN